MNNIASEEIPIIAITGGPGAGKTTTLNFLREKLTSSYPSSGTS